MAGETINSAVLEATTLPLGVVDALPQFAPDDEAFQGYVAAGPVEKLLVTHPENYADAIAERCQQDVVWAEAGRQRVAQPSHVGHPSEVPALAHPRADRCCADDTQR